MYDGISNTVTVRYPIEEGATHTTTTSTSTTSTSTSSTSTSSTSTSTSSTSTSTTSTTAPPTCEDFETGGVELPFYEFTGNGGTVTYDGDYAYNGVYGAKCSTDGITNYGQAIFMLNDAGPLDSVYLSGYMRFSTLPTSGKRLPIVNIRDVDDNDVMRLEIYNSSGTQYWRVYNYENSTSYYSTSSPVVDTWYLVELEATRGASGGFDLYINYNLEVTQSGIDTDTGTGYDNFWWGIINYNEIAQVDVWVDDICLSEYDMYVTTTTSTSSTSTSSTSTSSTSTSTSTTPPPIEVDWVVLEANMITTSTSTTSTSTTSTSTSSTSTTSTTLMPLWCAGFETGDTSEFYDSNGANVSGTYAKHGNYGMMVDVADRYVRYNLPGSSEIVYSRFWLSIRSLPGNNEWRDLCVFRDSSTSHFRFGYWNDGGTYKWFMNTGTQDTYEQTVGTSTWYAVELMYDAAADSHKVWIDGTERMSTNDAKTALIDRIYWGSYNNGTGFTGEKWWDSICVDSEEIGTTTTSTSTTSTSSTSTSSTTTSTSTSTTEPGWKIYIG